MSQTDQVLARARQSFEHFFIQKKMHQVGISRNGHMPSNFVTANNPYNHAYNQQYPSPSSQQGYAQSPSSSNNSNNNTPMSLSRNSQYSSPYAQSSNANHSTPRSSRLMKNVQNVSYTTECWEKS